MTDDEFEKRRLIELYERSESESRYTFTDFLGLDGISILKELQLSAKIDSRRVTLYGGYEGAERQIARFGNPSELIWSENFPIVILEVRALREKFAEELSHRDFLGALMALGIKRGSVGDIKLSGSGAYICALEHMAPYIAENLQEVRHTRVTCERVAALPEGIAGAFENLSLTVPSARADAVVSRLTGQSRSKSSQLFGAKKVFVNGRLIESGSLELCDGDIISLRGYGKYIFDGTAGSTKKGNLRVSLRKYV